MNYRVLNPRLNSPEGVDRLRKFDAVGSFFVLVLVLPYAVTVALRNLEAPFFWFDEAGQYLMATGRNHSSPFTETQGSLLEGLRIARSGSNMDPPGFTVLVRGWIDLFGSQAQIIRVLPMMFFIATGLTAYLMARKVFRLPRVLALLVPIAVLANGLPLNYAFEVRAFSLEMMSVLLIALLTFSYLTTRQSLLLVLICGATLLLPLISRYTTLLAVGASLVTMLVGDLVLRRSRGVIKRSLPPVIACAAASVVILVWYSGILMRPLAGMGYTEQFELEGKITPSFASEVLIQNFTTGQHSFTGLFSLVCILVIAHYLLRVVPRDKGCLIADETVAVPVWMYAFVFVVAYELFSMLLSAVGLSPWYASTRWSIGLTSISIISALGLAEIAVRSMRAYLAATEVANRKWMGFLTLVSSFSFVLALLRTVGFSSLLPSAICSLAAVAIAVILLRLGRVLPGDQESGETRRGQQSSRSYLGVLALISGAVAVAGWVAISNLSNYTSERMRSTIPSSIVAGALSVRSDSSQIWHVYPWLWPSFRFVWETDSFGLRENVRNASAKPLETSALPTDQEVQEYLRAQDPCGSGATTFVLLSGEERDFPRTLADARKSGEGRDCAITVLSDAESRHVLITFSSTTMT